MVQVFIMLAWLPGNVEMLPYAFKSWEDCEAHREKLVAAQMAYREEYGKDSCEGQPEGCILKTAKSTVFCSYVTANKDWFKDGLGQVR